MVYRAEHVTFGRDVAIVAAIVVLTFGHASRDIIVGLLLVLARQPGQRVAWFYAKR
jgi:hypothetical protein